MNYNPYHINRIHDTLQHALSEYPRTYILRIDLRFPDEYYTYYHDDSTVMTRFMASLKSQIKQTQLRKYKQGKRVHPCRVRYVWSREFGQKGKKHYHVALMLNNDAYGYVGTFYPVNGRYVHNLALMIMEAWVRTLNLHHLQGYAATYYPLVCFVPAGNFHINIHDGDYAERYDTVMRRLSYLAKYYSKVSDDGQHNFGCSQC